MTKNLRIITITTLLSLSNIGCSTVNPTMAIGDISSLSLLVEYPDFNQEHKGYLVSNKEREIINRWPKDLKLEVYFGTWCHDSVREVPRLLKIVDGRFETKLIALDFTKIEPNGRAKAHDVRYTPTIIVYQQGVELGRIIEKPEGSLVTNLDLIINKRG
ncbi:hypothetical protein [Thalassotalea ganghwensis]